MSDRKRLFYGDKTSNENYEEIVHMLINKYYNLYRSNFKWTGLNYRQENYIMNKFWGKGSCAAFKIKNIDELGYAGWAKQTQDMYGEPETVNLINEYGSPLVPFTTQIVDKDVVLGYIQSNKKPLSMIVDWYIRRIAQVEMVINTNLQIHKMPFLIPIDDDKEKNKIQDAIQRILNNELVLFVEGVDPNLFKAVATQAQYIIDKLQNYKSDLENDLKTYLGINNNGTNKIEQLQLAEVNSNNEEIIGSENDYVNHLQDWCTRIKEVLGNYIWVEANNPQPMIDGEFHQDGIKTGPKNDGMEE